MISKRLSASEIAKILSITVRSAQRRANKESWKRCLCNGNGRQRYRYRLADLPADVQAACAASLKLSLDELQQQIKPASKPDLKVVLSGYKPRSAKEEAVKPWDSCREDERDIAVQRQKIIETYENSGLGAKEFIRHYNENLIEPETKARLGRRGQLNSPSRFYENWLRRYSVHGLEGLVPLYRDRDGVCAGLSEEENTRFEYLYLDSAKPSVRAVLDSLPQYGISINEAAAYRYVRSIPDAVKDMYRKGADYFRNRYEVNIDRDYTLYKPMEIIVGDYMTHDVLCRIGEKIFRAKVAAFEDMRTRTIVGWSLQQTANSAGVVQALKMCFGKHGLPEVIYFDNGKEFKTTGYAGTNGKSGIRK
jgi:hypothetical protein